jgi:large subunit ribosomal protein L29
MKMKEIKDFSTAELTARLDDENKSLSKLRFTKVVNGQLENPARITAHKRTIARIKTILTQREKAGQ